VALNDCLVGYQVSTRYGQDRLAGLESAIDDGADLLEIFLDCERPDDLPHPERARLVARSREARLPLQLHASYGFPDNLGDPPLQSTFLLARALGASLVTVHLDDLLAAPVLPDFAQARRLGLTIAIENTPRSAPDPTPLVDLLTRLPADAPLGVTFDVGHANLSPLGPIEYARRLIARLLDLRRAIVNVHLHDNRGQEDEHQVLGEGTVDFGQLLPLLRDEGGCGRFVIERWEGRRTCLTRSRRWLGLERPRPAGAGAAR
jgi:sugar phosphate isomerase/epimerase